VTFGNLIAGEPYLLALGRGQATEAVPAYDLRLSCGIGIADYEREVSDWFGLAFPEPTSLLVTVWGADFAITDVLGTRVLAVGAAPTDEADSIRRSVDLPLDAGDYRIAILDRGFGDLDEYRIAVDY
jgi:hypothetical protein